MTRAKQVSAEYFETIGKQKLVDRFIELKRHQKMIEAELASITETVASSPSKYDEFTVVRQSRKYVPTDTVKAYVGEEWWAAHQVEAQSKPYLKIKA